MKCPKCGSTNTIVKDSRINDDETLRHRRHLCRDCEHRFSTIEMNFDEYNKAMAFKAMLEVFAKGFAESYFMNGGKKWNKDIV